MKRMSDVFELPISDIDGFCSPVEFTEQELHAVHAVNHVDALADALANLLEVYFSKGRVTTDDAARALDVLKAYAGEGK